MENEVMNMLNETIDGVDHHWATLWKGVRNQESVIFWPESFEYGLLADPNTKKIRIRVEGLGVYTTMECDRAKNGFLGDHWGDVVLDIVPQRAELKPCFAGLYGIIYYLSPLRGNKNRRKFIANYHNDKPLNDTPLIRGK